MSNLRYEDIYLWPNGALSTLDSKSPPTKSHKKTFCHFSKLKQLHQVYNVHKSKMVEHKK
jgi:hypothetical protein